MGKFAEKIEVVETKIARADDTAVHSMRLVDAGGEATPGQIGSELSSNEEGADTVRADPDRRAREAIVGIVIDGGVTNTKRW